MTTSHIDWIQISHEGRTYRLAIHERGDQISRALSTGNFYEIDLLKAIAGIGRCGIYLDVGTHIGNHALFFAAECPSTLVIGFEPWRPSYTLAKYTMKANYVADKVKIYNQPVASADGVMVTYTPPRSVANTGIGTTRLGGSVRSVSVDGILSSLVTHQPAALIKIDVEGFELEVLKGSFHTIAQWRPLIVVETKTKPIFALIDDLMTSRFHYTRAGRYCATPTWLYVP
jgi:FkbM family methyltransferase